MNWVLVLTCCLTFGSAVLNLLSVCLPYWLYTERPNLAYQGLWWRCEPSQLYGTGERIKCELILLPPEFLDAVRVMLLFGLFFYIIATICSFIFTCTQRKNPSLITAATYLMFFGALLSMIGVVTYGAMWTRLLRVERLSLNLHAGFGIAVCSVISGFLSVLFYCMVRMKGDLD